MYNRTSKLVISPAFAYADESSNKVFFFFLFCGHLCTVEAYFFADLLLLIHTMRSYVSAGNTILNHTAACSLRSELKMLS